ncbi:DUF1648 domain-containing protein [Streptomyces sp. NA02950]|uniref:DUF1648 domain-containing protein n=1 Tax=Streptomyces sp. NA02950 TaxID=2742137 RepID=UPI001590F1A6|nr:DUF1648 domain-containing protein [Streptomyces sp. NA02950]QKV92077.1 DUF1648 domain-containing protein [Streptomyces sp. NA02950]
MTRSARRALVVASPFALAWAAVLGTFAGLAGRLPDRLATHFGGSGRADGFTGPGAFLSVVTAVLLVPGAVAGWLAFRSRTPLGAQRALVAVGYGTPAQLGCVLGLLLLANADAGAGTGAGGAERVDFPLWHLAVSFTVAAAVGWIGWLLAGLDTASVPGDADPDQAPRLPLAEGELASWTHTVGSPVLIGVGGVTAVLGGVLALSAGPAAGLPLAGGGAVAALLSGCRVTVDRRGLTVAARFAPRPRLRVPLERIERATSREVRAMELGGWGYRSWAGRSGLVLRSGEALCLRLATGREFVVTVDDAATAAALLNTLAERGRAAGPGGRD